MVEGPIVATHTCSQHTVIFFHFFVYIDVCSCICWIHHDVSSFLKMPRGLFKPVIVQVLQIIDLDILGSIVLVLIRFLSKLESGCYIVCSG